MNPRSTITGFLAGVVVATTVGLFAVVPMLRDMWRVNIDSDVYRGIQAALEHVEASAARGDCERAAAQLKVFNERFADYRRGGGPPPADWYEEVIATTQPIVRD